MEDNEPHLSHATKISLSAESIHPDVLIYTMEAYTGLRSISNYPLPKYRYSNLSAMDAVIGGHYPRTVSYPPHVKEPVAKGHLAFMDIFSGILK